MKTIFLLACASLLVSCAGKAKKSIQDQVLTETQVSDGESLNRTAHQLVNESTALTSGQKAELSRILDDIKIRNKALTEEAFRYRGVLMRQLISGKDTGKGIKVIERQIAKIERERLRNTITTAKQIAEIVGGKEEAEGILDSVMYHEDSRYR